MLTAIRELLTGPPSYRAHTPWRPFPAALATLAILSLAVVAAFGSVAVLHLAHELLGSSGDPIWAAGLWLLTFQITAVVLTLAAAVLQNVTATRTLSLGRRPTAQQVTAALLVMLILMLPYNVLVLTFAREQVVGDLKALTGPLDSNAAVLFAIVIGVGAPLSEELLFRGFLLGALSKSRLGFAGAALVSTLGWTALHAGYSFLGLFEVAVAGLIFSWLLWRTGNLWVPIVCHGVYNTAMLLLVWLLRLSG